MNDQDRLFDSPCFSNGLWEAAPEAIDTSGWADTWPADTAASAPAIEDGLELLDGCAAPVSEISPGEPLYGEVKLIDKPHGDQLEGDAMILGAAVSCVDYQRDLCVSKILADLQAAAAAAAARNESSSDLATASAADDMKGDSTTTKTTRPLSLALAAYGNHKRSLSVSESPRRLHGWSHHGGGIATGCGGFRRGNDATNHSLDAGDSMVFPPSATSFQLSGESFEGLRASHAANPAGLDTVMTQLWHRAPELETLLKGGTTVQQPAASARVGVESESPHADAGAAYVAGAEDTTADQQHGIHAAGVGVSASGAGVTGDGGSGLTFTGLLTQMKRRKRHVGASGHMIDGARPTFTTDKLQDPAADSAALCNVASLRDTDGENSSSGSSSTAAEDDGGSSTSGMADGDRASSPFSGSEAAPLAQALSDAGLDDPGSPAVTHVVTAPNPAPTVTAVMRTRVVFAAETAVTLVPAMPAGSKSPGSPESIRRRAVLAALLQSSLARRRSESGIAHKPGDGSLPDNGSSPVGFAQGRMLEATQFCRQSTEAASSILSNSRASGVCTGNSTLLQLPTVLQAELARGNSPPAVQSASTVEQPEEASKPRGAEASKVGEREIREIREKGNKRAKLIARRMRAPHTGLRRVGPMEEYLQARSDAHPVPSIRATPSGPEAAAPAAAGSDRAAAAAGSTNPIDPNYRWHNYGNKVIAPKGEAPFLRKYYRCSLHSAGGCRATRTIDVVDGQPEKITFQGTHNHSPPVRKAKR
ncbi:unnamed protein product [Closterium sp. Yama58-4]|nr:unnamed protein product [Closterium sp. Yama58-4]